MVLEVGCSLLFLRHITKRSAPSRGILLQTSVLLLQQCLEQSTEWNTAVFTLISVRNAVVRSRPSLVGRPEWGPILSWGVRQLFICLFLTRHIMAGRYGGILCQNGDCRVVDRSQLSKQNVGFNQSCNALREKEFDMSKIFCGRLFGRTINVYHPSFAISL